MKSCTKCGETKPVTAFFMNRSSKDGRLNLCIPCKKVVDRAQYERNKHKILARNKEYARENPEISNRAKREYLRRNRVYYYAKTHAYRANKRTATMSWDIELTDLVTLEAAHLALIRKNLFQFPWEVDHVVPLQGKYVCGLHVWNNLQVIPRSHNRKKKNIFIPT